MKIFQHINWCKLVCEWHTRGVVCWCQYGTKSLWKLKATKSRDSVCVSYGLCSYWHLRLTSHQHPKTCHSRVSLWQFLSILYSWLGNISIEWLFFDTISVLLNLQLTAWEICIMANFYRFSLSELQFFFFL